MPHESYHFQNTATKKNKKNPYHVTGLKPGTMWWISSAVKFPTALKKPPINGSWKSYARGRLVNIRDIHKKKLRNWSSCKSTCIMMGNIQYFKVFNFSTQTFFLFVFFSPVIIFKLTVYSIPIYFPNLEGPGLIKPGDWLSGLSGVVAVTFSVISLFFCFFFSHHLSNSCAYIS